MTHVVPKNVLLANNETKFDDVKDKRVPNPSKMKKTIQ